MPVSGWASLQREALKKRLKHKNIPILCFEHSKVLTRGDMALIDQKRCQKCAPPSSGWPPPWPPKKSA